MRLDPVAVKVWVLSPAFCCGNLSPSRLQMPMNPIHEKKSCCGGHNRSAEAEVKPSSGAKYFCPMCPGVESEKPSDCPKCGMALERNPLIPDDGEDHEIRALTRKFWIAAALTLPVFFLAMAHMIPGVHLQKDITKWIEFILTIPVVFWVGGMFFTKAWVSLKTWNLNMFTLIATGVGAAFIHSSIAVLAPGLFPESFKEHGEVGLYFEASAVITVLVLLGQLLEAKARARTGEAIQALMGLAAKTAHRLRDGNEEDVPIDEIKKGDLLRVRSGEKVPLDGTITEGGGNIDESMITGEPMPVMKKEGDPVIGATLNQNGSFVMRAVKIGSDTLLSQIVRMVAEAQRSRAPIQKIADTAAGLFVPIVVAAAIITFIIWSLFGPTPAMAFALVNAVSVLIIACPCALGLATPMSIMVGIGKAAGMGILVKNAGAIELTEKVTHLVTDKTGTLTAGKPRVTDALAVPGIDSDRLIQLAASVEVASGHPLARAIVAAAVDQKLLFVTDFASTTAGGVTGRVDGVTVRIGKSAFLSDNGITIPSDLETHAAVLRENAKTVVWIALGNEVAGILAIADPIKETSAAAIRSLHDMGLKIIMCTGDNRATAEAVARELGIDEVHTEVMPQDKIDLVRKLRKQGAVVAMAGDGINDAPALAAADVGIAMGAGSDVAIESASITLVKGDLMAIAKTIHLSRATMRNIRQNLFFAFIYNAVGVPIAAGVLYPFFGILLSPMIAGAAMSFSSVSVIMNALRLKTSVSRKRIIHADGISRVPAL
jgi:Cu+-exporting ATPase